MAAGAVVATGQILTSLAAGEDGPEITRLASGAFVPSSRDVPSEPAPTGVGGDQVGLATPSQQEDVPDVVDVQNLTKAVALGEKLTQEANATARALANGAPASSIFHGAAFVKPCVGAFTSGFAARWGVFHYGIDLANRIGTPIYAVTDGVVVESGPASGFGMWVRIEHPGGWTSVYGHINRSLVVAGQHVKAGQEIAEMGNRGISTGPHLHLEIWDPSGRKINPIPWLATRGIKI